MCRLMRYTSKQTLEREDKMITQLELAKSRLFDEDSLHVKNIKFFPVNSRDTTPEQMAEQANKAISQIETGDFEVIEDADVENDDHEL